MAKIQIFLKSFRGRIRGALATFRNWVQRECQLTPVHWRWATYGILFIMALLMLGRWLDYLGELHPLVLVAALVLFVGLPLLAGLGVRLGISILRWLPHRYSWLFFGAVFFILINFRFPEKAQIVLSLFLICAGSFLGAGIYNLFRKRWTGHSRARRILTLVFLITGAGLFCFGLVYLLYPGKAAQEIKTWSLNAGHLPACLEAKDPSHPGFYLVDSLTYGWGRDPRREEYGSKAHLVTPVVDGSNFLDGWEKFSGKLRTQYWKMGPDSLGLNGRVWYPLGEGSFPLVLMVHGNHMDRDFSDPGYDYLGRHFATHGIIAVSVDENYLNGAWSDFSKGLKTENDCRGWLLLKHLEQWRSWSRCDSSRFYGKVDLDRVALIGHSRGGEAVSIAACFNQLPFYPDNANESFDFGFGIRGVAAIAPVDGQYWPGGIATPVENVNYFTIQGSMDADLRSYDGLRQMRRVGFKDSLYHFASGLYVHGANHGQFNRSWGLFDVGYPDYLLLNRKAIIPVEQQEKVALVYLTAFLLESLDPGQGYLPLFKDFRSGRNWLPDLVFLSQFHESNATILCEFDEDLDLTTGTSWVDSILATGLSTWKEGRIPKKWGDYRNNGVFLGWNNEKDSLPGRYCIVLDTAVTGVISDSRCITFLAADAQIDAGERIDTAQDGSRKLKVESEKSKKGAHESDAIKEKEPYDFFIILTDTEGIEYRVKLGDYQKLQPPLKPTVFKSGLFWKDPESEVILQYAAIPLNAFRSIESGGIAAENVRSICFEFGIGKKGSVILDQIGFSMQ